jgi:amino acid transporter
MEAHHAHPHLTLHPEAGAERGGKGLKKDAIGFIDGLIIGIASTAPAYSLAAVLAIVVGIAGVHAPAVLLASFVPMFLIAASFYYMNRADPDCGTTFSWITRAMGPSLGWVGGWAVCTTGIIVVGSLAQVAAYYTFDLLSLETLRDEKVWQTVFTILIIGVMTLICVLGTELSALVQRVMIFAQVGALLLFAVVALVKVAGDDAPAGSLDPELSWFSPFAVDSLSILVLGLLTGVFIYWGWESAVNLNEETEDSNTSPGLAAVVSTVILLVTYVATATAVVAFAGLELIAEYEDDPGLFGAIAPDVLGNGLDWLVTLAIITSALASTQTTILPASRTALSMARQGAYPEPLGRVHRRFLTPHVSTVVVGVLSAIWFAILFNVSENFLFDSLTSLSLMIAFYYALNGFACAIYYRRELLKSVKNFLFIGVGPVVGGGILAYLFFKAIDEYRQTDQSYTGNELFGIAIPVVLGVGLLLLGTVLMLLWRATGHQRFFGRKTEVVHPDVAAGRMPGVAAVPEEAV